MGRFVSSLLIAVLGGALGAGLSGVVTLAASLPVMPVAQSAAVLSTASETSSDAIVELATTILEASEDEEPSNEQDEDAKPKLPGRDALLKVVQIFLGVTQQDIEGALKTGQSIAELAVAKGKTRDALVAELLRTVDPAVDQVKAKAAIERLVNAKAKAKATKPGGADGIKAVLDELVASGMITAEQETKILEALRSAFERAPAPPKIAHPDAFRFSGEVYQTARDYLGATQQEIEKNFKDGRSLADLALAKGKTRDGLIGAILDASVKANPALDRTKAQEAIAKIVDQKFRPNAGQNKPKPVERAKPSATPRPSATPSASPSASPSVTANRVQSPAQSFTTSNRTIQQQGNGNRRG